MEEHKDYIDTLQRTAQGQATPATPEDVLKHSIGFTHPDLLRTVDPKQKDNKFEISPREYKLSVQGTDGYLTTKINTHTDEENPTFQETDEDGKVIGEREIP